MLSTDLHRVEGDLQLGHISENERKAVAGRFPREGCHLLLLFHSLHWNEGLPHTENLEVVVLHSWEERVAWGQGEEMTSSKFETSIQSRIPTGHRNETRHF